MVYGIFYYLINGIAWYCFVLYCVVGFGARAVSRKTPIYFIEQIFLKEGILTFLCSSKFISFTDFRSFSLFSLEDKTLCSLE